jgi:hypothetical protein
MTCFRMCSSGCTGDVALDASTLIYYVEGSNVLRERVARRLDSFLADAAAQLLASRFARLECRVKPLRDGDNSLLGKYDAIFGAARFVLLDVTAAVLERATELRARHGFKTPRHPSISPAPSRPAPPLARSAALGRPALA